MQARSRARATKEQPAEAQGRVREKNWPPPCLIYSGRTMADLLSFKITTTVVLITTRSSIRLALRRERSRLRLGHPRRAGPVRALALARRARAAGHVLRWFVFNRPQVRRKVGRHIRHSLSILDSVETRGALCFATRMPGRAIRIPGYVFTPLRRLGTARTLKA